MGGGGDGQREKMMGKGLGENSVGERKYHQG